MPETTLAHVLSGPFKLRRFPLMAAGAGTWLIYSSAAGRMKSLDPGRRVPVLDTVMASSRYFTVARRGDTQLVEFRALQNNIMAEFRIIVSFQIVVTDPIALCTEYSSDEVLSNEARQMIIGKCRTVAFENWTRKTGEVLAELRTLTASKIRPPHLSKRIDYTDGSPSIRDSESTETTDAVAAGDTDGTTKPPTTSTANQPTTSGTPGIDGSGWELYITDVVVHPSPRRFQD